MARTGVLVLVVAGLGYCGPARGQRAIGDIMAGKLVKPEVGVWAWYDLSDYTENRSYLVRHAIVAKEKVKRKTGYWTELEVVPKVGFKSVYKMLLTGPASKPGNVHRALVREGDGPIEEVALPSEETAKEKAPKEPERKLVGEEEVDTVGGKVPAKHFEVMAADGKVDLWINEKVRPMGIVRMKSAGGELLLRNYGIGGHDARSVIDGAPESGVGEDGDGFQFEVRVESESGKAQSEKD